MPRSKLPPRKRPASGRHGLAPSFSSSLFETAVASQADIQKAVLVRIERGLKDAIRVVQPKHLLELLATQTPLEALVHLVNRNAVIVEMAKTYEDPLREARARAPKQMAKLLASEGGPLGVQDVADRLRITRAGVDKRRKQGKLIGIDDGGRAVVYPGWQFTATGTLPGLEAVLSKLRVTDPWMRIQFFLTPDPDLDGRPLDALRAKKQAQVEAAARRYGSFGDEH
jgi:hypothetical protein